MRPPIASQRHAVAPFSFCGQLHVIRDRIDTAGDRKNAMHARVKAIADRMHAIARLATVSQARTLHPPTRVVV